MTYFLYFLISSLIMLFCAKHNIELPDDTTMLILAILTAGEVIAFRVKNK